MGYIPDTICEFFLFFDVIRNVDGSSSTLSVALEIGYIQQADYNIYLKK